MSLLFGDPSALTRGLRRPMQGSVTVAFLALMLGACSAKPSGTASTEIAVRVATYLAALERADADGAGDYWATGSRLVGPGIDLGRDSLLAGLAATFRAGTRVRILRRQTNELFAHGASAYEIAFAEEIVTSPGTKNADTTHNNMFIRWEKGADDRWRFGRVLLSPQRVAAK